MSHQSDVRFFYSSATAKRSLRLALKMLDPTRSKLEGMDRNVAALARAESEADTAPTAEALQGLLAGNVARESAAALRGMAKECSRLRCFDRVSDAQLHGLGRYDLHLSLASLERALEYMADADSSTVDDVEEGLLAAARAPGNPREACGEEKLLKP